VPPLPAGKRGLARPPVKTGSFIRTRGPLLVLSEVLPDNTEVTFSASRGSLDRAVMSLLRVELLVAACALALATLLVLRVTRTALRPLSLIVETATRITAGDSKRRLEPSRTDTELGSMAASFDLMVDALEAAVEDARASEAATRRFLADASHELRTPVAAVQASVETLLREQPRRPDRDRLEAALAREVARLGRLVDDLLSLARLEARPRREPIRLVALATTAVEEARARAPRAELTVTGEEDAHVEGGARRR
jgi:signal transduction histidine kinase